MRKLSKSKQARYEFLKERIEVMEPRHRDRTLSEDLEELWADYNYELDKLINGRSTVSRHVFTHAFNDRFNDTLRRSEELLKRLENEG